MTWRYRVAKVHTYLEDSTDPVITEYQLIEEYLNSDDKSGYAYLYDLCAESLEELADMLEKMTEAVQRAQSGFLSIPELDKHV